MELAYLSQNPFDLGILGFKMTLDLERRAKNCVGVLVCRLSPYISGWTEDVLADDDDAQQYELQKSLANPWHEGHEIARSDCGWKRDECQQANA
jgi:hypothetical protein